MDVLADIFETIQLKSTFYFRTHFSPPWGTTVARHAHAVRFHYIMQGRCWIRVESGVPVELSAGDFVLVPSGASHMLTDQPGSEAPPLETVLQCSGYRGEALFALGQGDPSAATQSSAGTSPLEAAPTTPFFGRCRCSSGSAPNSAPNVPGSMR